MDLGQQEYNGNAISPVLPEGIKNYLIDIDGTITDDVPNRGTMENGNLFTLSGLCGDD